MAAFDQEKQTARKEVDAKTISKQDFLQKLRDARALRTSLQTETMQFFLQEHKIDAGFANTLLKSKMSSVIIDVLQLLDYISKTQVKVQDRVEILDVTPLERHLWNTLVTKQTPQRDREAIKEFIKLALNAMGYTVANQYENKYEDRLKPPDIYIRGKPQTAFYRDDLDATMRGKRAFVKVYMNIGNNTCRYVTTDVFWKYDERTKFFGLYYGGYRGAVPLFSLSPRDFTWTMKHQ